jgi:type I restriction enzyme, R subunit
MSSAPRITTSASSASISWTRSTAATTPRAAFSPTSWSPTGTPSSSVSPAPRCSGTTTIPRLSSANYLHKYYYNASIADGYTLRLIREEIATEYKLSLQQTLKDIKILQSRENREIVYASETFVRPMLDYILKDFEKTRRTHNAPDIGAMVICDSAAQARKLMELFGERADAPETAPAIPFPTYAEGRQKAAEPPNPPLAPSRRDFAPRRAALILHDEGSKDLRKEDIEEFKQGRIDLLFVYNMLLTGFDAPRLKKLYLGRVIRAHNLLQALTRVNRTYPNFRYGYVVDFANIQEEFKKTNQAYFEELQLELGDELKNYSNLFKPAEEIRAECEAIQDALCHFDLGNAEAFSRQISQIHERGPMLDIVRALDNARDLYNVIRQGGQYDLLDALDFKQLLRLRTEAQNHLALINQKLALENHADNSNLLHLALEDIVFAFRKVSEAELRIADELKRSPAPHPRGLGRQLRPLRPRFPQPEARNWNASSKEKPQRDQPGGHEGTSASRSTSTQRGN